MLDLHEEILKSMRASPVTSAGRTFFVAPVRPAGEPGPCSSPATTTWAALDTLLDQVIAWSTALAPLRQPAATAAY